MLAAVRGVDLSPGPGPAFIWWQLAFGAAIAAFGAIGIVASRLPRFHGMHGLLADRLVSLVLIVAGAATVVRSFRIA